MTVLYVTEERSRIKVKHQQFQVYSDSQLELSLPANQISYIVLFGSCYLSHGAVSLALRRQIPVMFLSHQGRYFGRLQGETAEIDYLTQQVQRSQDKEFTLRRLYFSFSEPLFFGTSSRSPSSFWPPSYPSPKSSGPSF